MTLISHRAGALLLAAGIACAVSPVYAQDTARKDHEKDKAAHRAPSADGRRAMCYFTNLTGLNIKNSKDETVGEVRDIIFDRHSGDIAAYVVSSSWFPWGDTQRVLFPSEVHHTTDADGKIHLNVDIADKEALKERLSIHTDAFSIDKAGTSDSLAWWNRFSTESDGVNRTKPPVYPAERITNTKPVVVEGDIVAVDRVIGDGNVYRSVIQVRDKDGNKRTILVAPVWYLSDQEAMPMRGRTVRIDAVPIDELDGATWAASTIQTEGGKKVTLRRGDALTPSWISGESGDATMAMRRRLVLGSSLIGKEVKCREELSGEIENLVIDHAAERVTAYVIDPNDNFLGVADTTRLIPASVASPTIGGTVYLDATKDMILRAPAAPDNLNDLNMRWELDKVFDQRSTSSKR